MNLIKFAIFFATTKFFLLADFGHATKSTEVYTSKAVGEEQDAGGLRSKPVFLEEGRRRKMCQSCSWSSQCQSRRCSWNYVCYDSRGKGANGCRCTIDSNCQSGRCASYMKCAPKVKNGHGCAQSNDCESGFCGWDFACHPLCKGEKNIPFMVTNVNLTKEGGEYYWGYHNPHFQHEMIFLKDIKYCPDAGFAYAYRIYGKVISPEHFKQEVEAYIKKSPDHDHVLYNIHGFNVDPESSFMGAFDVNNAKSGYLVIPINWKNKWGLNAPSYEWDRNNSAPKAGRELAAKFDVFKSSVPTSIMCHSMGNYVFRVMAQNVHHPRHLNVYSQRAFQNVFMVAADARMDMFSTGFNPKAPRRNLEVGKSTDAIEVLTEVDIPADELKENGGFAITRLTHHVHVVWNSGDYALDVREAFQMGGSSSLRKAIGRYGNEAEALTTLPYFKKRVTYHDFSGVVVGHAHNYQWSHPAVALYKKEDNLNSA